MTRFEMMSWYWARNNALYLDVLSSLDESRWMLIDYTNPEVEGFVALLSFLKIKGVRARKVQQILNARVTPVIATHLGIGAWGLAYMVEDPPR